MAEELIEKLDSFDAEERRRALEQLAASEEPEGRADRRPEVNLHCHTFFSYNAYGYSPSRFTWEAHRYGLEVAGIVDFDVLDGVREFLEAGQLLRLKTIAGFESRVFIPEYSEVQINSPKEPGVFYLIGTGFTQLPQPGTRAAETLESMARCARRRNEKMLRRVNEHLDPVTIDYEEDVLPLTPASNATERHMLVAYERRAREMFPEEDDLAQFWAEKLDEPLEHIGELLNDVVKLKKLIRARLMKYGGVGYAPPEEGSFPSLDEVVQMTLECGALPSGGWLDGTSEGESDPMAHFAFLRDKGIPTITVIPDRNWNLDDPAERRTRVQNFHAALKAARRLHMPVLVGTEMNKHGQKFVDTFGASPMEPHRQQFLDGAHIAWGHTLLKMTAGVGVSGPWARERFGGDVAARNEFFRRVGAARCPADLILQQLSAGSPAPAPQEILDLLEK